MPKTTDYTPILDLVSLPRINSYQITFHTSNDYELYGAYLWCQQVGGNLYPLIQNLEITVRNAIDNAAKKRFGNYWWEKIYCNKNINSTNFMKKIDSAIDMLDREWIDLEKKRLSLKPWEDLPITSIVPTWPHDKIIAATDFSAWHYILNKEFISKSPGQNNKYLWPKSLSSAFKNYSSINPDQSQINKELSDLIFDLRQYRNRLFHHEPLWVKAPTVTSPSTAIDTIRAKVNNIEKVICAIDTRKLDILNKVGLFSKARRVCTIEELGIYTYVKKPEKLTKKQTRLLRGVYSKSSSKNESILLNHSGSSYILNKFR
ncbi:Abi family protein [Pantoea ananatis]|uniref:Abi family protein n=1 Tax=Pantoea ananas TaxID=553 RepID=UPI001B318173|nr:Abi family protein [Pantoea ananatis]